MMNRSKASLAGMACMAGGLAFIFYFIGLPSILNAFIPIEANAIPMVELFISCAASVCLAGGPMGLLALNAAGTGREKVLDLSGAAITLLGLASYVTGSLYIYFYPGGKQFFTPAGSFLLTLGMSLLSIATIKTRRLRGWRGLAPLLVCIYFPLQFPLQVIFFLGKGRGPNPILLGVWGVFWLLLGYAIWSSLRGFKFTRFELDGLEGEATVTSAINHPN